MYYEKTVVNQNGDKVKIRVNFWINQDKPSYSVDVAICKKGKRKFEYIGFDSYKYKLLSLEERKKYQYNRFKEYVTEENILEAKKELWNLLSPVLAEQT